MRRTDSASSRTSERKLTDAQIATIAEWVRPEMPEGDPAKAPWLPQFAEGWRLGKPDLILEMPVAFALPASGPDVFPQQRGCVRRRTFRLSAARALSKVGRTIPPAAGRSGGVPTRVALKAGESAVRDISPKRRRAGEEQ